MGENAGALNCPKTGAVIIGRNEGNRLIRCLETTVRNFETVVYVDSGSTDDSCENAQSFGAHITRLNMRTPFTAARARNAGFEALLRIADPEFIQFIDGDCELIDGWARAGLAHLMKMPDCAIVCGRRREKQPNMSVYNRLCDWEWNTPIGPTNACGGDMIARTIALKDVGGYNPALIAGEEPDLCVRLKELGWSIWRIDHDMTWHDADMTRFKQWWVRNRRSGHAYAEGAYIHRRLTGRPNQKEVKRITFWAGILPVAIIALTLFLSPQFLWLIMIYPLQVLRLAKRSDLSPKHGFEHALFLTIGKFPEMAGMLRFAWQLLTGKRTKLIEYK